MMDILSTRAKVRLLESLVNHIKIVGYNEDGSIKVMIMDSITDDMSIEQILHNEGWFYIREKDPHFSKGGTK